MAGLPDCAINCLAKAFPSSSCDFDFGCMCQDQQLIAQTQACSAQACTIKETLTAQKGLYTVCQWPVTEDRHAFPIVLTIGLVLSFISVALRMTVRSLTRNFGVDDGLALLSLCAIIALSGLGYENQKLGLGIDLWFLSFQEITDFLHYYFAIETLYLASIALTKTSMLCLYLRLFPEKKIRTATTVALAFTASWGASILLANVFSCSPVSYMWTQWDREHTGTCVDHAAVMNAHAITNIVFDVVIIALPMPTLLRLNMNVKRKIGVVVMFAVGLVVTVVSILRCVSLVNFDIHDNPTKKIVDVSIWSVVEVDLSIICACLPSIRAFAAHIHNLIYGKSSTSYYNSYESSGPASRKGTGVGTGTGRRSAMNAAYGVGTQSYAEGGRKGKGFIELQETETETERERERERERTAGSRGGIRLETSVIQDEERRHSHLVDGQGQGQDRRSSKAWFDMDA